VWTSDGRTLLYATERRDGQRLVARDLGTERSEELLRFEGGITFVVSPDGDRVAFQVVAEQGEEPRFSVLDRRTGAVQDVTTAVVPAFFWSPAGDRLLFLLPEEVPGGVWFRWGVWDGESAFTGPRFFPTVEFGRDYLQFFEQYAQSTTLWAPDGSAFAYAGSSESGESGIWVQAAEAGAEPILVAPGVFAAWSPA
jgi:Tol biopolymer transport system component